MKPAQIAIALLIAAVAFAAGMRVGAPSPELQPVYAEDAAQRYAEILQMRDPGPRASALAHFFSQANPTDADALLGVMNEQRKHVDAVAEMLFASWWARFDPARALEERFPPPWSGRHPWVRAVLNEWTVSDPEAALAAVVAMGGESWVGRQEASRALIRNWFRAEGTQPERLLHIVALGRSNPREQAAMSEFVLEEVIEAKGLEAAAAFVDGLGDGSVSQELQKRLAIEMFGHDEERAVRWALEQVEKTPRGWGPLVHLAGRWGWEDGESAMRWATSLPESEYRDRVVQRAFRSWLSIGEKGAKGDAARAWLAGQEITPALEPAYSLHLQTHKDPAEAVRLAEGMKEGPHRTSALRLVGRRWLDANPEAAMAWIDEADLPPKLRRDILSGSQWQQKQRARQAGKG